MCIRDSLPGAHKHGAFADDDQVRGGEILSDRLAKAATSVTALGTRSDGAVSYTHLDVYKRQDH